MEQKEIRYGGMTTRPSDYNSPDGELGVCYNLINEDSELKPLFPPTQQFTLPEYEKFFCIHKIDTKENYIIYTKNHELQSYQLTDGILILTATICTGTILSIVCVGATLVILMDDSIQYALFKENGYKLLGSKPPFLDLSFGLHGNFEISNRFCSFDYEIPEGIVNGGGVHNVASNHDVVVDGDGQGNCHIPEGYDVASVKNMFSDGLMAEINKYIQQRSVDAGKFIFPFFVRYAYRLYDGSHILHSAPVLLMPNNYITAYLDNDDAKNTSGYRANVYIWSRIAAMVCKLNYSMLNSPSVITQLKAWSDVIKEVDIFISAPIYTYDQSGKVRGWLAYETKNRSLNDYNAFTQSKLDNGYDFTSVDYSNRGDHSTYNRERNYAQLYVRHHGKNVTSKRYCAYNEGASGNYNCSSTFWLLPQVEKKTIMENITNCSLFYKCATLNIPDLSSVVKDVEITGDTLKTLQQRERLQDDYQTHNEITASYGYNYNARLYLADIKQVLFNGFSPSSMLSSSLYPSSGVKTYTAYVFLKKEGREIIVKKNGLRETSHRPLFLFYPDTDAYKMILAVNDSSVKAKEFKLTPHNLLNGSYWYGDFENITLGSVPLPQPSSNRSISTPNKLFASEVNNPFYFPIKNRNNIGTTKIIAISSASQALSQGQFGQFPLYAFTLDGVWALEVSSDGNISTKQPATRDVINPNSTLLQVDGGVVFSTAQGIMLLNGANSVCISEVLDNKPFANSQLPHINTLLDAFSMSDLDIDIISFKDYIKECQMAYDYANSRILVFNKTKSYCYVYSLKSHHWTLFNASYQDVINDYPTSLVVDPKNGVLDLSILNKIVTVKGVLITRPLKLDSPDTLKTITSLVHRIIGESTSTKSALYGSVDCVNFHLITSSSDKFIRSIHGTPYKYFIVVIHTNYRNGESLSGTSILYNTKRNNKLR